MVKKNKEPKQKEYRPPIVALLGHVDHGKTSLLDKLRSSSITEGEEGGITQSIAAYTVSQDGKDVTFVDTPGHEAFDLMRTRGGAVADIVVLVVAADDSVKPQTKESVNIIKDSGKPSIVAINKVDISGVDIEKVKRDLVTEGLVVESMGGNVPAVEVSAKTGKGIPELIEMIHLVAEVTGLSPKLPPEGTLGEGVVLESTKDARLGFVSTIVVTAGEFTKGACIGYADDLGNVSCVDRIRGFIGDTRKSVDTVAQGYGIGVIGLRHLVPLGSVVYCVDDPRADIAAVMSSQVKQASEKQSAGKDAEKMEDEQSPAEDVVPVEGEQPTEVHQTDADLLSMLFGSQDMQAEEEHNILNVVIKANVRGTLDAILKSLESVIEDGIIKVARADVGDITVSDIELAMSLRAIVIGFRIAVDPVAEDLAQKNRVPVKAYQVIYELVDEIEDAAAALQLPDETEEPVGSAEVRKLFVLSNGSTVLGVRVTSGEMKHGAKCRVMRGEKPIAEGKVVSMRSEKEIVQKAGKGTDCGVVLDVKEAVEEGDVLKCYRIVKR